MKKLASCLCVLLLVIPIFADDNINIERFVRQRVVRIFYDYSFTDLLGTETKSTILASGVILNSQNVLTNKHLVSGKPVGQIRIHIFRDNETLLRSATIEKFDFFHDLLLLRLDEKIKISDLRLAEKANFGEEIYFRGYSALDLPLIRIGRITINPKKGIYVTPIYNGDSGGGVFNANGELVGLIYITYVTKTTHDPLLCGYAIPIDIIREFLGAK